MKRYAEIEWDISCNIKEIWAVITNNNDFSWRSDLAKIEIQSSTEFREYTKAGGITNFVILNKEPYHYYSFNMENKFFSGIWVGKLIELDSGHTRLIFTETLDIRNPVIWLMSFFMINLVKIQENYMRDLQRRVEHAC